MIAAACMGMFASLVGVPIEGASRASAEAATVTVTVTGNLLDGTAGGAALPNAFLQLRYLDDEEGFLRQVVSPDGSVTVTGLDGAFALELDADLLVEGRHWVLTVMPPLGQDGPEAVPTRGAAILPFTALGPVLPTGDGPIAAGAFTLPAPDVVGRVTDHADAAVGIADAFVSLVVDVEFGSGEEAYIWASEPLNVTTSPGDGANVGHFAFHRPDPVDFAEPLRRFLAPSGAGLASRLSVRTGTRFDLVPFEVDLPTGPALAVAAQFPVPEVTGTLRLTTDGAVAPGANFYLERLVVVEEDFGSYSYWEFAGQGGQTFPSGSDAGRFAAMLPSGDGPFRIFFERPEGGGPYPAFGFELAGLASLTGLTVAYPPPDLYGTVDLAGFKLDRTGGVVSVQRLVEDDFGTSRWQWTDIASSLSGIDQVREFVLAGALLADGTVPEARLRLRVSIFEESSETSFVVPMPPRAEWLGSGGEPSASLRIVPPAPNVTGTVVGALVEGGQPIGLRDVGIELRRYNQTFRFWDWTDIQTITRSDGSFSLVVPDDLLTEQLELRIRPLPGSSAASVVPAFSYDLPAGGDWTGLTIVAGLAPLRGTVCLPGCEGPVGNAWVQVEKAVVTPFGTFWDWTEGFATTSMDGSFALDVPDADPSATYRIRVFPPFRLLGQLVEFTQELDGPGIERTGVVLAFPLPNIGGDVVDGSGERVSDAWVNLLAWSDALGGWEWITSGQTSRPRDGAPGGVFQLFADPGTLGSRPLRLDVRSSGDREDLVPFQRDFVLPSSGTASFPGLTFPSPNLDVLIEGSIGGSVRPVPYAFAWVERVLPDGRTEQLELWQSAGRGGRLALRIEEPGAYRMHVHAPWGLALPTFQQDFTISAGGVVSGLPATLTFPTPNLLVEVEAADGSGVRFAHVELRRVDPVTGEEQWLPQNGTTDRTGIASLSVAPGDYRVYVTPPWFDTELSLGLAEVSVPASGAVTATVVLRAPNLIGTLDQGEGALGGAWIEVVAPAGATPVPGVSVPVSGPVAGEFRLSLSADGEYTLVVWPGRGNATSMPLEVIVTVAGGDVTAWRYAGEAAGVDRCPATGACEPDLSFADPAVAANLGGTVLRGGAAVAGAFVNVVATGAGSAGTPADWRAVAVTRADGSFRLRIPTDITVELTIALPEGDTLLIADLPVQLDAGSGLANTLEVEGLLRVLSASSSGSED